MATALTSIYDAIAAWTPTHDSDDMPTVRNYDEQRKVLHSADCPIRILSPVSDKQHATHFVALGKVQNISHRIEDIWLLKPVSQGQGIASY